jgi:hypothetical protein
LGVGWTLRALTLLAKRSWLSWIRWTMVSTCGHPVPTVSNRLRPRLRLRVRARARVGVGVGVRVRVRVRVRGRGRVTARSSP